ncbi:MAG: GntR family transcriptional regulator, partial [Pseudomonadota bacterium]
ENGMSNGIKLTPIESPERLSAPVYEALKRQILALDIYDPASELRMDERGLADQLGISRTPLREAIMRLEQEGFVEILPRRGVFIRRKSLDEILEMLELWGALEGTAARIACTRAADAEIAGLRRLAGDASHDPHEYSEANIAFHRTVLTLSGNRLMIETGEKLLEHLAVVRRRAMADPARAERSVSDHAGIVAAIEGRHADLAARRVEAHTARLHAYLRRSWRYLIGEEAASPPTTNQYDSKGETHGARIADRA